MDLMHHILHKSLERSHPGITKCQICLYVCHVNQQPEFVVGEMLILAGKELMWGCQLSLAVWESIAKRTVKDTMFTATFRETCQRNTL